MFLPLCLPADAAILLAFISAALRRSVEELQPPAAIAKDFMAVLGQASGLGERGRPGRKLGHRREE